MKQEEIAGYNRRIVNSNATGLIAVLFDIYFAYEEEAIEALQKEDVDTYVKAVRQCGQVMQYLKDALDFTYDISKELYSLYTFVQELMAKAMYMKREQEILEARKVVSPIAEAFAEIAKEDKSEPMMENTQQVTAGLTYGKKSLNEAYGSQEDSRGFWA